jgi:hypothetical protein|nr:MAG TPA: hypothetical protein [Caudoviricetes sp.]
MTHSQLIARLEQLLAPDREVDASTRETIAKIRAAFANCPKIKAILKAHGASK